MWVEFHNIEEELPIWEEDTGKQEKEKEKKGLGGKDIFDEKFCSPRCLMGIMLPMTILMIWAPPHPCPKFQPPPLPSGPNPAEQQEQPHSLCYSKAHENRDWLLPTTSTREGPPLSKKKRTRWVQSTPNFSVAHKSTPENQIQQDLTTCRDAGAPHTGKKKAILQQTLQQRSTRTRRTHYRRKGRPLWLETNAIVDDSSMWWLLVSSWRMAPEICWRV